MLNGKPVVILDVDDVVAKCVAEMTEEVFEKTGKQYTEDDIKTWDFFDTIHDEIHPGIEDFVTTRMRQKGWCLKLQPFPGSHEGLKELQKIAEVFFCTSPFNSEYWEHERRAWLYKHFQIPSKRIIQGKPKFLVRGELLVDDKIDNCTEWVDYDERGIAGIWDRPHNRLTGNFYNSRVVRILSWDHLHSYVHAMWPVRK